MVGSRRVKAAESAPTARRLGGTAERRPADNEGNQLPAPP